MTADCTHGRALPRARARCSPRTACRSGPCSAAGTAAGAARSPRASCSDPGVRWEPGKQKGSGSSELSFCSEPLCAASPCGALELQRVLKHYHAPRCAERARRQGGAEADAPRATALTAAAVTAGTKKGLQRQRARAPARAQRACSPGRSCCAVGFPDRAQGPHIQAACRIASPAPRVRASVADHPHFHSRYGDLRQTHSCACAHVGVNSRLTRVGGWLFFPAPAAAGNQGAEQGSGQNRLLELPAAVHNAGCTG